MTNTEMEALLKGLADKLMEAALAIRATTESVGAAIAFMRADGQIAVEALPPEALPHRVEIISTLVRSLKAVAFVFVYDGYYTLFDTTRPCPTCKGRGCEVCRFTGGVATEKHECVNAVARARWGFLHDTKRCYKMIMGVPVPIELANDPASQPKVARVIDPYGEIFGAPLTVH